MSKVFVGGSRHLSRLHLDVTKHLDIIIENRHDVLVGDANGADKAVQAYLSSKGYDQVEVFCTEGICRNNLGKWSTRVIGTELTQRNAQFYSVKDRVMAQEASIGLMIWDGKSVGTLLNVFRLLSQRKSTLMYISKKMLIQEFRSANDWDAFIAGCDDPVKEKFEQRRLMEPTCRGSQPYSLQTALQI